MDRATRYRIAHPDRIAVSAKTYYDRNREAILEKKREAYHSTKEAKKPTQKVQCPLCCFQFCNERYLKKHIANRHKCADPREES